MDTRIFLEQHKSKKSSNTSEGLDVELKGRRKLLPTNDFSEVISQYDQYREEREKCNIIRLTCQVNPICSNVLFNHITEIVHDEGSSAVTFLNYGVDPSNGEVFENIIYKPQEIDFWSGNTMQYQSVDEDVANKDPKNTKVYDLILTSKTHYTNGQLINDGIMHPTNAIRDTQLSKTDIGFVYHCGLDFFNNHLVRSNTFKTICKCPKDNMGEYTAFNTIGDLMRNVSGEKVIEKLYFPTNETSLESKDYTKLLALHLYEYDDILTYENSVKERLIPTYNGWVGFENKSKIKSYVDFIRNNDMKVERPLMYYNGGDFVDMYPDRSLYSFVPRYNEFQERIEKNWNYCITYPSSSYTPTTSASPFSEIIECNDGLNSMKTIYFDETRRSDNGTTMLVMYSVARHGLAQGDFVNIYKTYDTDLYWVNVEKNIEGEIIYERVSKKYESYQEADDEKTILSGDGRTYSVSSATQTISHKILDNAEVSEIVDEYIFTVFNSNTQISDSWVEVTDEENNFLDSIEVDGKTYTLDNTRHYYMDDSNNKYYIINESYVNFDDKAQRISYKKVVGDIECNYYVRIFSKLPNFKFASGDTSSEYEIYRKRDNNEPTMLEVYQDKMYDFENHISNLAFAKNIYTDEVGEIVFTDDIDISNIHDNLGRPLTSLYLTFIKNNKGYKEWYGWNGQLDTWSVDSINTEYENIEYSHCFGPITCGMKMSDESIYDETIPNIVRINNIEGVGGYNIQVLNGKRTYKSSDNSDIDIDFNEIWYDTDKHFYGDLCYYDNYNAIERHIQYVNHRFNTTQRELYNHRGASRYFERYIYDEITKDDYDSGDKYLLETSVEDRCNELKEGYYYIPHYEIPIKTFGKIQTMMPDFLTLREMRRFNNGVYQFTTLQQHFLGVSDKAMLYDTIQEKYYNIVTISGENDTYRVFTCKVYDDDSGELVDIDCLDGTKTLEYLSTSATMETVRINDFKLFKMDNLEAPSYARVLKDGTCRVIWRDVLNNGFNEEDDTVEEYPFTNGAFYVNRRIDLYLRRQDPYNYYGLYNESDIKGELLDITKEDNYVKDTEIEC